MLNTGADQPPWRSGLEPPYQLKVYRALSKPLYIFMAMEKRKRRLEVEEEKISLLLSLRRRSPLVKYHHRLQVRNQCASTKDLS